MTDAMRALTGEDRSLKDYMAVMEDELTLFADMIEGFEDSPAIDAEKRVCDHMCQEDRDKLLLLGLRCHILANHINYLKDHPDWDVRTGSMYDEVQ